MINLYSKPLKHQNFPVSFYFRAILFVYAATVQEPTVYNWSAIWNRDASKISYIFLSSEFYNA